METYGDEPVSVQIKFWLESDGSIGLEVPGALQRTIRIKDDPLRPSGHPRLYRYLARHLRRRGVRAP